MHHHGFKITFPKTILEDVKRIASERGISPKEFCEQIVLCEIAALRLSSLPQRARAMRTDYLGIGGKAESGPVVHRLHFRP